MIAGKDGPKLRDSTMLLVSTACHISCVHEPLICCVSPSVYARLRGERSVFPVSRGWCVQMTNERTNSAEPLFPWSMCSVALLNKALSLAGSGCHMRAEAPCHTVRRLARPPQCPVRLPRFSWPLPAQSHWEVKVGGTSMRETLVSIKKTAMRHKRRE